MLILQSNDILTRLSIDIWSCTRTFASNYLGLGFLCLISPLWGFPSWPSVRNMPKISFQVSLLNGGEMIGLSMLPSQEVEGVICSDAKADHKLQPHWCSKQYFHFEIWTRNVSPKGIYEAGQKLHWTSFCSSQWKFIYDHTPDPLHGRHLSPYQHKCPRLHCLVEKLYIKFPLRFSQTSH